MWDARAGGPLSCSSKCQQRKRLTLLCALNPPWMSLDLCAIFYQYPLETAELLANLASSGSSAYDREVNQLSSFDLEDFAGA